MSREPTTNWYEKILSFAEKVCDNQNIADDIREITDLLNQCKTETDINLLLQGLSAKDITTGTTGLYCLMAALINATRNNNSDAITKITNIITILLNKCNSPQDITAVPAEQFRHR